MPRRLPSLNALRAFEAAARHNSFTGAAAELHVSHAAISRHVRGLEARLGVTLFRTLTGTWPFQGRTVGELLSAIESDAPPRPRALAPGVPRALEAIVLRCLAKDPGGRFGSMGEVGSAMDRFLRGWFFFGGAWWFGRGRDVRSAENRARPDAHGDSR